MFGVKTLKKALLLLFCIFVARIFFHNEDTGYVENKMEKLNIEKIEFDEILKEESYRTEASDFDTEQSESQSEQMVDELKPADVGRQMEADLGEINSDEIEENIENYQTDIAEQKLPRIAILGVKKCGTIALSQMMKMHPKIMVPSDPEVWFWTYPREFKKGLDHYKVRIYKYNC